MREDVRCWLTIWVYIAIGKKWKNFYIVTIFENGLCYAELLFDGTIIKRENFLPRYFADFKWILMNTPFEFYSAFKPRKKAFNTRCNKLTNRGDTGFPEADEEGKC